MSSLALNPLGFAADALGLRGALVEDSFAILPPNLARELELPPEMTLTTEPGAAADGTVSCALGSALLEKLVRAARAAPPVAQLDLDLEPPRTSQAASLAQRFVVRNALTSVEGTYATKTTYAVLYLAWAAEADDRHAGIVEVSAAMNDASVPLRLTEVLDLRQPPATLHDAASPDAMALSREAVRVLASTAETIVAPKADALVAAVRRRHQRDHLRIYEYFAALIAETRTSRRKIEPAARDAKITHFEAERDAKLAELRARYTIRTTIEPAALVLVTVPTVDVQLRLRRRKQTGDLILRLPAGAAELDAIPCAACARATIRPAVCDEKLHPLCETCVPSAQGRPACVVCR